MLGKYTYCMKNGHDWMNVGTPRVDTEADTITWPVECRICGKKIALTEWIE